MDRLTVSKGVFRWAVIQVTYGELVGDKPFQLAFTGTAPVKPLGELQGRRHAVPRNDMPDKVSGKYVYMQHVRVPGMLHGRVVRPRGQGAYGAGAKVLAVDETSIAGISGARVLRKGDFVGVVAENEWDAVRAARQLKVTWDSPPALAGSDGVYEAMRAAKTEDRVVLERGNAADAIGAAPVKVSYNCRAPYQAHAPFGPNCALADVKSDSALVMCSTQDVYGTRTTLARILGLPVGQGSRAVLRRLGHLRP